MADPDCARMRLLAQADHDGELGVAEAAALATHLAGCADCRAARAGLAALSRDVRARATRHAAPAALRLALERQAADSPRPAPRTRRAALGSAAALALAASVALWLRQSGDALATAAVASHIRALQPGHLTDVLSSDQHTVKPWFDGKLDYAPPARDFADAGFMLLGGRLDYLDGRTVAALAYRHDRHVIDVYVWPGHGGAAGSATIDGYNLVRWAAGGMRFIAVSDLNLTDLRRLAALWAEP